MSDYQVRDIKFSESGGKQYIVVNDVVILGENVLRLYLELFTVLTEMTQANLNVNNIWFSHAPCLSCIASLKIILNSLTVKPTLFIEKFRFNGSNYDVLQNLGCLSELTYDYDIKSWNWEVFGDTYGGCYYYGEPRYNIEYKTKKSNTVMMIAFIRDYYTVPALVELCHL